MQERSPEEFHDERWVIKVFSCFSVSVDACHLSLYFHNVVELVKPQNSTKSLQVSLIKFTYFNIKVSTVLQAYINSYTCKNNCLWIAHYNVNPYFFLLLLRQVTFFPHELGKLFTSILVKEGLIEKILKVNEVKSFSTLIISYSFDCVSHHFQAYP